MNITRLASYINDDSNHLSTIIDQIHSKLHYSPTTAIHCLPYQRLCESQIKVAAAKSLQGILFNENVIKLLDYQPPPKEAVVAGDSVDKSSLVVAVREVLQAIIGRAIKPSPLKMALRPMEMERVYSIVVFECLGAVAECKSTHCLPPVGVVQWKPGHLWDRMEFPHFKWISVTSFPDRRRSNVYRHIK